MAPSVYQLAIKKLAAINPWFGREMLDRAMKRQNLTPESIRAIDFLSLLSKELDQLNLGSKLINSEVICLYVSKDGKIEHANPAGIKFLKFFEKGGANPITKLQSAGLITPSSELADIKIKEINLPEINATLKVTISPIFSAYKEIIGSISLIEDITFQRQLDKEILEQYHELKKSNQENARLAAIVSGSRDAIISKDLQGRITSWNQGAEQLFEYSAQEAIGQSIKIIIPKEIQKNESEILSLVGQGKSFSLSETVRLTKSNQAVDVSYSITPLRQQDGTVVGGSIIIRDITKEKRTARQLIEAQKIAKIGNWDFNLVTKNLVWSDEHHRILEIPEPQSPELLMDLFRARVHPDDLPLLDREIEQSIKTGNDFIYNFRLLLDDGKRIKYIQQIGTVLKNRDGIPESLTGTSQDRTREVELDLSLQRERAKSIQTAKLASLGELSAGVAHEVNNPLAIIAGNISLLDRFKNDQVKFNLKIETINKAVERISKIINGLRKFSRTSEKNTRRAEELGSIIQEVLILVDSKSKRHSTPVRTQIQSQAKISCDLVEIEQVLINLVNNAIDAAKMETEKWVEISLHEEGDEVIVRVINSGTPISQEIEKRIFEPFFTTKPAGEGTGLGLSISKGILDEHRAKLSLNRTFKNTCFEIRFKRAYQFP